MQVSLGTNASNREPITWDSKKLVNGHCLIVGMSGSGKTHELRNMISQMEKTSQNNNLRFHVFDVHGDIEIKNASSVMFSEQTNYGMNPLRVNPNPHFGGVRKSVQGFISIMNSVMRILGPKQEAALRNILYDLYERHGFKHDDPSSWHINENEAKLISDGSDGRLYLDVPLAEKDDAKQLGARWEPTMRCWYIAADQYDGAVTRWAPKTIARTHPSIADALRMARYMLKMSFFGTGVEAITQLEITNKAASAYQRKRIEALRRGENSFTDEKLEDDIAKAQQKAIDAYSGYITAIKTGDELESVLKYDSTDVLKSVVDRLENLDSIGIFKAHLPPFDDSKKVWHYNIRALSLEERQLFVLYRLTEIFERAVERGEQDEIQDVIVLDESHIYVTDDPKNPINTIAKEARKFGVSLICASQSPTHFPEDFITAVSTKIILGIDESYWKRSMTQMRVTEKALAWIKLQSSMLVQMKQTGETRNEWIWARRQ